MTGDRRTLPFSGRVAHVSLRGKVEAESFTEGSGARLGVPLADLCASPFGKRERQLLLGAALNVFERRDGAAFMQAAADGYCGWVAEAALAQPQEPTHWVAAPASHLYPEPQVKQRETAALSLGARVRVVGETGKFAETADGGFIPRMHLREIGDWAQDPVAVAESLLGTPYLWGGNSRAGIDCSGLVQAALSACGLPCPADSDQQCDAVGTLLAKGTPPRRGDLLFWPGHVAMAVSDAVLIHANGASMSVAYEGITPCLARIAASDGPLQALKRL
ncbi:MAG: NlpC/P60 family protein [Phaeovulum sp.]|uniref:C40 family peptidase n=1 Tax=Phaeovulum sp. TaxID=2934796 RepID=UPI00272F7B08|nr:NlpC/P60 family protein [Phaeovulum sp.]MDP2061494.1 NlpC/P60 family protein [Phaeovulum sp.]MDP3860276.1 NlpC/P60 family protein [Phaeovulum sp.]